MQCALRIVMLTFVVCMHQSFAHAQQTDTVRNGGRTHIPGNVTDGYLPLQDSAYRLALQLSMSGRARFHFDVRTYNEAIKAAVALQPKPSEWEIMQRNMMIPASILAPSPQEITQYRMNIANAQYVPGVLLWPMGSGNLQVNMSDIAKVFGLVEDVSPRISYAVEEPSEVVIVIYSASAILVRTLFRGVQSPGSYELDWDGKNDAGKMVIRGDYIAEVQLGRQRIIRKRIVWPPQ